MGDSPGGALHAGAHLRGRTLGESFSAAFLVIGLELIDRAKAGNTTSSEFGT